MNNSAASFPVLSRSQRHFFCEMAHIPTKDRSIADVMSSITKYMARYNMSYATMYELISTMRRQAQYKADSLNTALLVDSNTGPITGVRILKAFNSFELTRLAYKLRVSRVYCTRVFIAFELADIAQAKVLTVPDLNLILCTGVRPL